MFCCAGFQNLISSAGQRGLAVIVWRSKYAIRFILQSRGIDFSDEDRVELDPPIVDINISFDVGLRYCPFCGRRLSELAGSSPKGFEELARVHEDFNGLNIQLFGNHEDNR